MSRSPLVALVVAFALAVAPGSASADDPIITDPANDSVPVPCVAFDNGPDTCGTEVPVPIEAALDILEGDLTTDARHLVVSLRLRDLDTAELRDLVGARRQYAVWGGFAESAVTFSFVRETGKPDQASIFMASLGVPGGWAQRAVPAVADGATDTITWSVPLSTLAGMQEETCPSCSPLGRGTVVSDIRANTRVFTTTPVFSPDAGLGDHATGSRSYVIGEH